MPGELVHIALGGTISMRVVDGLAVPSLSGAELAELAGIATTPVELAKVGGPQLSFELLVQVSDAIRSAQDRGVSAVIVTLGTDAMEEVGAFLSYCGPWDANVVVTGSMEPGAEPHSDGPRNLQDAAAVATRGRLPEPVVVFAGRVMLARAAVKISGVELDAFASPTQPFWSVDDVLAAGTLPESGESPPMLGPPGRQTVDVPIVLSALPIVTDAVDGTGPTRSLIEPAAAIVCVGAGAGNLTPEVSAIAEAALSAGSTVAITTRALDLRMSAGYGYPGGSGTLAAAGAVLADGMSAHRVRIYLLIALSQGLRGVDLSSRLTSHVTALRMTS